MRTQVFDLEDEVSQNKQKENTCMVHQLQNMKKQKMRMFMDNVISLQSSGLLKIEIKLKQPRKQHGRFYDNGITLESGGLLTTEMKLLEDLIPPVEIERNARNVTRTIKKIEIKLLQPSKKFPVNLISRSLEHEKIPNP